MNKVHAFQIKEVEKTDWMFADEPSYRAIGHNPKESEHIPLDMMELFKPEAGHFLIRWAHGLVTFRDPESFAKDYRYLSGTVYETEYEALFLKGMMSEEGQAQLAEERLAKLEERKAHALRLQAMYDNTPNIRYLPGGGVIRRIIPGLVAMPEPMVQPRSLHISHLPLIIMASKLNLSE